MLINTGEVIRLRVQYGIYHLTPDQVKVFKEFNQRFLKRLFIQADGTGVYEVLGGAKC